jgi:hypothetical protein
MRRRWGIIWLAATIWLAVLICAHLPAMAVNDPWEITPGGRLPWLLVAAQTPLETQMLGEKPFKVSPSPLRPESLLHSSPTLIPDRDGGATLRLPYDLEMRISVLYQREPGALEPQGRKDATLLFKYAMDYRLLPNLQVGLNGYLYRAEEGFSFQRPYSERLLGVGPGIKYDLGRWSFLLKSQLETGHKDRGDDLQNWFRVWYAF